MPVGKTVAECLQALGVLEKRPDAQTKKQWPQNAKSLSGAMAEFADSIEDESFVHDAGESLNKWVEERATEWVLSNSEFWSAKDRLPHAPVFPKDQPTIIYWVQQYVLYKWYTASRNRKMKETSTSLPGLHVNGSTAAQTASTQDIEQVQRSEARGESHDLDGWDPYGDSDTDEVLSASAAQSSSNPPLTLPQSVSSVIIRYNLSDSDTSRADDDLCQSTSSNLPAANDFRSRTYAPVTFLAEMYTRITFLIGPSQNGNGNMSSSYARIMGLEEAQKADTFRAGVSERLGEMGEVVGSRKLVAKPDWMSMPFVVDNDHDHHYLLEALKTWGAWKTPGLSVVYISLEHEV